ncbi:hypothetical protein GCM10007103_23770 [Salinimicrobium marinum]|uniref:Sensor of ECF-type sigma factor n=2 Tax=Salinimicrobium marinum TaxID=680283 RepID=A0A918SHF8_9FLAO|nr:hypothetical protein GCM10007103_23770 [Salinimicrobium marinum]
MKIKMKKLFLLGFVLLSSLQMLAQDKESRREQIKALKTAYITEGLNLTPEEAQKFWPVYNKFDEQRRTLHKRERADIQAIECITEERANEMVEEYVQIEKEDYLLKKKFFEELRTMFSAKRIIQLKKTEDAFNRKLLKEYRERHANESNE